MAEYIDREKAIKDFERCNADHPRWTPQRVKTLLLRVPAADVAPVVRCKDCKYCDVYNTVDVFAICRKTGETFIPFGTDIREHFCAYGERKETSHDN